LYPGAERLADNRGGNIYGPSPDLLTRDPGDEKHHCSEKNSELATNDGQR